MRICRLFIISLLIHFGLLGCSGGGGSSPRAEPDNTDTPTVTGLEITTSAASNLEIGQSINVSATATFSDGATASADEVEWSVGNSAVLQATDGGNFNIIGSGSSTITAIYTFTEATDTDPETGEALSGAKLASNTLTISALCDIESLSVTVNDANIQLNTDIGFSVEGMCSNGATRSIPSSRLSADSLTPGIAALAGNTISFLNYGDAVFRFTYFDYDGQPAATTTFELELIDPVIPESIAIEPAHIDLCVSQSINLSTTQHWSDGTTQDVSAMTQFTQNGAPVTIASLDTSTVGAQELQGCFESFCDTVTLDISACPFSIFVKTEGWEDPHIYTWSEDGEEFAGAWPGSPLMAVGDGWFRFDLPSADPIDFVITNYDDQVFSDNPNKSIDFSLTEESWCELNTSTGSCDWITADPRTPTVATLTLSPRGKEFNNDLEIKLDWLDGAQGDCRYTLDGSSPLESGLPCRQGDTINIGDELDINDSVTLRICVINSAGESCETQTYTKSAEPEFSWDNASVYFVLTDRFYNGNTANDVGYPAREAPVWDKIGTFHGGDLAGLTQKVSEGYFTDLGVDVIWISSPLEQVHGWARGGLGFNSSDWFKHYAYHGYWPKDFTEIDNNMGSKADFATFIDTAHEHGIRVVMDVVMNHVGYYTIDDLVEDGMEGVLVDGWETRDIFLEYFDLIDFDSLDFTLGWGPDWIRAGLGGHETYGPNTEQCGHIDECPELGNIAYLPDLKTESTEFVDLPPFLAAKAARGESSAINLANATPRDYLITWLTDWVRDYGIDGFRIDTVRHVEKDAWLELKNEAISALREWKAANPEKALDNLDFWMTGEYWMHQPQPIAPNGTVYSNHGFDSMINFGFQDTAKAGLAAYSALEQHYALLSGTANRNNQYNLLSYISSHDRGLFLGIRTNENDPNATAPYDTPVTTLNRLQDQMKAGSILLLSPGAIQIFYGDETAREDGLFLTDPGQASRSAMNWGENPDVLAHWQKVGQFRRSHRAVGSGQHALINSQPYTFSRQKGGDKVIVAMGVSGETTVNVGSVFADGITLRDAYSGSTSVVANGQVTFTAADTDLLLIELAD